MLLSTKKYEELAFKLLVNIQQGRYSPDTFDFDISREDFFSLIGELLDYGFVEGYTHFRAIGGYGFKAINPRVTGNGLAFIEMVISNKVLRPLAKEAQKLGLKNARFTKDEVEKILELPSSYIQLQMEALEYNGLINITSKQYADNELYYYEIQLTPIGFNQLVGADVFNENQQPSVIHIDNSIQTTYSNSTVVHGNITISDSFKQTIESTNLDQEFKDELIELITQLIEEKQVTKDSESKIKKYFGTLIEKAGETAVTQSVIALVKALLNFT